jgi:type IV pilus assembly protein PilW
MIAFLSPGHRLSAGIGGKDRQQGLTLVELMVAMTISLILLAAISQVFITSRQTYTIEESQARTQEAGRFAMEFLSQDIRMAGYTGCSSKLSAGTPTGGVCPNGTVCSIANPNNTLVNFNPDGISAYRYTGNGTGIALTDWTPNLSSDYFTAGDVLPNTDVIIIHRGSTTETHLTGNTTPSNANVQILNTASIVGEISADDILMVSDCRNADIFRATGVSNSGSDKKTIAHANSSNSEVNLTHSYGNDAQLMKLISRAYYIGTGASGEPALFRKELTNSGGPTATAQELVEGVEDMRLSFGEETEAAASRDYVPNRFVRADAVTNFGMVVAVRVGLVTRTSTNVAQDVSLATPLSFDGISFPAPASTDRRRRQYYLTTIQKRN